MTAMRQLLDRLARALGYHTLQDLRAAERRARDAVLPAAQQADHPHGDGHSDPGIDEAIEPAGPVGHLKYFVSYTFSAGRGTGFGACEVSLSHPVRSHADTQAIGQALARKFAKDSGPKAAVVILNWRRFEDPEPPGGGREGVPMEEAPVILRLVA
jgi:hypothetical protein